MTEPRASSSAAPGNLRLRSSVAPGDVAVVDRIVRSTAAFREDEIGVACELVQENLARGAAASGYHFLFAEWDGTTVAYACYGPIGCSLYGWDLYWIAVEQSRRGGGLGGRLLDEVERAVAAAGGRRIYVETSSRPDYAATRSFYTGHGYVAEARLEDFYAPGDSKIVFVKVVAPSAAALTTPG